MKYILRKHTFRGAPPKYEILAVGEKQFIRAVRKRNFRARCIFDSDTPNIVQEKMSYAPPRGGWNEDKHYYSIEQLLAENFEVCL